ncbi:MAG: hypothetical protein LBN02_05115 [Oscillospiraceae bacterium]|nr:hypothetical protein [Oscillospiraceae bacterium]
MKKILALLLAVLMVVAIAACGKTETPVETPTPPVNPTATPTAPATPTPEAPANDFTAPPELTADYVDAGAWPLPAGTYYPELDNQGIPAGAHVISAYLMAEDYSATPLPVIESLTGYEKVDSTAALTTGTWTYVDVLGYPYIFIIPVGVTPGDPTTPSTPETPAAPDAIGGLETAFPVGVWPLAAGAYDPGLDGQGIPDGAVLYGLFDAAYATIPAPTAVDGYTQVSAITDLTAGTWFLLAASSGFGYVVLIPVA